MAFRGRKGSYPSRFLVQGGGGGERIHLVIQKCGLNSFYRGGVSLWYIVGIKGQNPSRLLLQGGSICDTSSC